MILTVTANAAIDKRYVVDGFETGGVNRVKSCDASAGGKGLNVARVASILGEPVTATGFLGGHAGKFISEQAEASGLTCDFVWCEGESRTCINIWDEANRKQTEFLEPGFSVRAEDCSRLVTKLEMLLPETDVLTISGSVPKGADAGLYRELIRKAKRQNVPVVLDTSGKLLTDCVSECPTVIKPNADEIRTLTGDAAENRETLLEAGAKLQKGGIPVVVISLGREGALVFAEGAAYDMTVPEIQAVNTVGCGDSMVAGLAVGMARHCSMEETIRLAGAASVANAMRQETGFLLMEDLNRLLPQIQVRKI